jgi:hypothetical protein
MGNVNRDKVAGPILLALRQAGAEGMTRTEINRLFGSNQQSSKITGALQRLTLAGKARMTKRRQEGLGRPTEWWFAI